MSSIRRLGPKFSQGLRPTPHFVGPLLLALGLWHCAAIAEKKARDPFSDPPLLSPKVAQEEFPETTSRREKARPSPTNSAAFSALLHTPLGKENTFDKRFRAWGGQALLALPIIRLGAGTHLHGESGLSVTGARVTITQPSTTFTHFYFAVPVRLTITTAFTNSLEAEVFAGAGLRIFEYDSRSTVDGGFYTISDFFGSIDPDGGVGIHYHLSERWRLRAMVGYLFLGGGVEMGW